MNNHIDFQTIFDIFFKIALLVLLVIIAVGIFKIANGLPEISQKVFDISKVLSSLPHS